MNRRACLSQAKNKIRGFLGAVVTAQGALHLLCPAGERILAEQGVDGAFEAGGCQPAPAATQRWALSGWSAPRGMHSSGIPSDSAVSTVFTPARSSAIQG